MGDEVTSGCLGGGGGGGDFMGYGGNGWGLKIR